MKREGVCGKKDLVVGTMITIAVLVGPLDQEFSGIFNYE